MPKINKPTIIHLVVLAISLPIYWQALTGNWIFDGLYLDMAILQPILILIGFFSYPYYLRYIIRLIKQ